MSGEAAAGLGADAKLGGRRSCPLLALVRVRAGGEGRLGALRLVLDRTTPRMPRSPTTMLLPEPRTKNGTSRSAAERTTARELLGVVDDHVGVGGPADADGRVARERLVDARLGAIGFERRWRKAGIEASSAGLRLGQGDRCESQPAMRSEHHRVPTDESTSPAPTVKKTSPGAEVGGDGFGGFLEGRAVGRRRAR